MRAIIAFTPESPPWQLLQWNCLFLFSLLWLSLLWRRWPVVVADVTAPFETPPAT